MLSVLRLAADGDQQRLGFHLFAFAVGQRGAEADAVLGFLDVLGFRAGLAADAGLAEVALQFLRDLFVFHGNQARQHFEHRDFGAEAIEDGGELDAHRARADDGHGLRNGGQIENFDVGEDGLGVGLQAGQHARFRAGGDDDVLRLEGLGALSPLRTSTLPPRLSSVP